jgi:transketolase
MRYLVAHPQPSYLRLGKAGEPCFHVAPPVVEPGRCLMVSATKGEGRNCLLTTGATLDLAMQRQQSATYSDHAVKSMPLWGMANNDLHADKL